MTEITAMPPDRYRLIIVIDNVLEMEEIFKLHVVFANLPHVDCILHFRRSFYWLTMRHAKHLSKVWQKEPRGTEFISQNWEPEPNPPNKMKKLKV